MTDRENARAVKIHDYYKGARYVGKPDVPYERVMLLADMAVRGVMPDGTFGDDDCVLWEEFSFLFRNKRCKAIVADF